VKRAAAAAKVFEDAASAVEADTEVLRANRSVVREHQVRAAWVAADDGRSRAERKSRTLRPAAPEQDEAGRQAVGARVTKDQGGLPGLHEVSVRELDGLHHASDRAAAEIGDHYAPALTNDSREGRCRPTDASVSLRPHQDGRLVRDFLQNCDPPPAAQDLDDEDELTGERPGIVRV
jgi:hypothetical protein